jgi:hypothetical protein
MKCCRHIEHDPKKHIRVFRCDHCKQHFHRDDSSAEIHGAVAWSEIVGYAQAERDGQLPVFDPDDKSTVKYFRPMLFRCSWMMPGCRVQQQQDPRANGS